MLCNEISSLDDIRSGKNDKEPDVERLETEENNMDGANFFLSVCHF